MKGFIYFLVIILANSVGAISGMGGGVIIKPLFDFLGFHSVSTISFYSAVAVFTMSIVSTTKQLKNGVVVNYKIITALSIGAILGGILGNRVFDFLLIYLKNDSLVQSIQIILTVITLVFALLYSRYDWKNFHLKRSYWYFICGMLLGFLASLLGIGGGPINVSLLMLLFSIPIKEATVYSICTIFFSQLAKLATIGLTTGFAKFDLEMLLFIIPAAIIGGWVGASLSKILSEERVILVFQFVILLVLFINLYNGAMLFL